jgi:hypothetical protein
MLPAAKAENHRTEATEVTEEGLALMAKKVLGRRNVHFCIPPVARNCISRRTKVRSDHPRKRASSVTG